MESSNSLDKKHYQDNDPKLLESILELRTKIRNARKKNKELKKENQQLTEENIKLQYKSNSMIQCENNISSQSTFLDFTELKLEIKEFSSCYLKDFTKRFLERDLLPEERAELYQYLFAITINRIKEHFEYLYKLIKSTLSNNSIPQPLEWVLKKSFQLKWHYIKDTIENKQNYTSIIEDIQKELWKIFKKGGLNEESKNILKNGLKDLLKKLLDICLKCYLMIPEIFIDYGDIYSEITYSKKGRYDHWEGTEYLVSEGENVYVLIPEFYTKDSNGKTIIEKGKVIMDEGIIHNDYE